MTYYHNFDLDHILIVVHICFFGKLFHIIHFIPLCFKTVSVRITLTDILLGKEENHQNEDKNVQKYASCAREIPDWGQKMFTSPISDMPIFSGKKENQSISVITNFFLDHLKKDFEL